jgi:hypothetical protein
MIPLGILQNSHIDNLPEISVASDGSKQKAHKRPWSQEEDDLIRQLVQ